MRIYGHICLCYAYEALSVKQKTFIFIELKKPSKRNLHIVKTSCWWMKAILFQVFDHFANSPTNYRFFETCLILSYEKWEENWNSRLKSLFLTHELYVFTRKDLCFSQDVSVPVSKSFVKCLFSVLKIDPRRKMISLVIFDTDHSFKR